VFGVFDVFGVFGVAQNIEAFEWPSQTMDGPNSPVIMRFHLAGWLNVSLASHVSTC
jgi:hypothetical protein